MKELSNCPKMGVCGKDRSEGPGCVPEVLMHGTGRTVGKTSQRAW